jgi:hypothetical protein
MKKEILLVIALSAVILILLGFLMFVPGPQKNVVENKTGIEIFNIEENQEISSPSIIKGKINGNGWSGFEGQVGNVQLQDNNKKVLGQTYLPATTDWMQTEVFFEANLNFVSNVDQNGILVFHNENASGLPEKNREFILPVKILK